MVQGKIRSERGRDFPLRNGSEPESRPAYECGRRHVPSRQSPENWQENTADEPHVVIGRKPGGNGTGIRVAEREMHRRKVFEEVPVSDLHTTRIPRRTRRVLQKSEGFLVRTRNPQRFIRVRHRRNIDARESREQIPSCGVGCEPVALRSICQGDLRCAVPDNDPETFK